VVRAHPAILVLLIYFSMPPSGSVLSLGRCKRLPSGVVVIFDSVALNYVMLLDNLIFSKSIDKSIYKCYSCFVGWYPTKVCLFFKNRLVPPALSGHRATSVRIYACGRLSKGRLKQEEKRKSFSGDKGFAYLPSKN
jgi:hypothetical protein